MHCSTFLWVWLQQLQAKCLLSDDEIDGDEEMDQQPPSNDVWVRKLCKQRDLRNSIMNKGCVSNITIDVAIVGLVIGVRFVET